MKQELGLAHFEGRSWNVLHHHVLLTMIAFCFLQFLRLGDKKGAQAGATASAQPAGGAARADPASSESGELSTLRQNLPPEPAGMRVAK
jgi:hypothetical protein